MPKGERRLAAIVFTDMVGYTTLGQRNESLSLAIVAEQRKLIRPILKRHRGREIKTMGDAFLVEFPSALDAVKCSYDIQRTAREYNISAPIEPRIHLRIGIHLGDVIESDGDISGDAVNVASRIEALAEDGGVCLTRQVYDHVQNKFQLPFLSLGVRPLKNVDAAIEVYKMVMPWDEEKVVASSTLFDKRRIAVLPMTNISPDPQDEYFAEGMTDELISTISRIQGLRVVARTSSMRYGGSGKGVSEISQELRTGSVLEGTVRKAGNRLRVTAQLVDPESEENLWSQTYDRELGDVFNIQSDIARNVAEGLKLQLHASQGTRFQNEPTKNTEAYSIYLKGRYFWNRGTADSLKKALVQFELAVKKDPNFALGYSGLADTYLLLGRLGIELPKLLYPKAIEFAAKAIALDESIAEPHATLAAARQEYEWKWEEAEREFKLAIELNPSYAWAHSGYGLFLGHVGRYDEAIESTRRAQELDPFSPRIHTNASEEYLFAHRYDMAIEAAERAIEIDSSFPAGYGFRGDAEVEKGMYVQAIADFQEADKLVGFPALLGMIGYAHAISGRTSEARRILEQLKNDQYQRPTEGRDRRSLRIALVHIGLGNNQLALDLLERVFEDHSPAMAHLKSWPPFSRLQGEPRYRALLKKVGLDR